jgi:hypothetical protein
MTPDEELDGAIAALDVLIGRLVAAGWSSEQVVEYLNQYATPRAEFEASLAEFLERLGQPKEGQEGELAALAQAHCRAACIATIGVYTPHAPGRTN